MARIYLASSWRNEFHQDVLSCLRLAGHQVYDFKNPPNGVKGFAWSEIDPDWQDWTAEEYRRHLTTNPTAALGYLNDFRGMEWADTCVLLLPCGRSAHLEAGWFAGRGKRLIILTRDGEEPELMALMANHICTSVMEVCYHLLNMDGAPFVEQNPEDAAIATCESCGKFIEEGEPYLLGPTDLCAECAPTWQSMIDEPEGFTDADENPLTPEAARALFDAHIAAGGKPTDSMAKVRP